MYTQRKVLVENESDIQIDRMFLNIVVKVRFSIKGLSNILIKIKIVFSTHIYRAPTTKGTRYIK